MNAIHLFHHNARINPEKMALATIQYPFLSFKELSEVTAKAQRIIQKHKIQPGEAVLLATMPGPHMYGFICALLGLGIKVIFIEPWLSLEKIQKVIEQIHPRAFIFSGLGKWWGVRSSAVRKIPHWINTQEIEKDVLGGPFQVENLDPHHHAFVVFSSGTTGAPKGVVRTHHYLQTIYDLFTLHEPENYLSPDLAVFPNVALFHLSTGRGAIITPQQWNISSFSKLIPLLKQHRPETISTGPAFLKKMLESPLKGELSFLKRIVLGGALSDCDLVEDAIKNFPQARFLHIYGGSEAEPIAIMDAREAVKRSRAKGLFQVLCLGRVIPQVKFKFKHDILWVAGPNVAGEYIGGAEINVGIKERDAEGVLWHCMGDRIQEEDGLLWFMGRQNQSAAEFALEQKIYSEIKTSLALITQNKSGELTLLGENLFPHRQQIQGKFPEIKHIGSTQIKRDRRHRSRIDRKNSLPFSYRINIMSTFSKWNTYLKERSPLPVLFILAGLGSLSSVAIKRDLDWALVLFGILFNMLLFIQLRLADELKDFEKDKVVNPGRPLPRGLLKTAEVDTALKIVMGFVLVGSLIIGLKYGMWGGGILALASIFGWLMYHEFFIGQKLNQSPILYAITHQIIVFFIYGWIPLAQDHQSLNEKNFWGWMLVNFGSSFSFEICRKLNPQAHPMAQTYAQHYGRETTAALGIFFLIVMWWGSFMMGFGAWLSVTLLGQILLLLKWTKFPDNYKKIEGLSALNGLIVALAPALIWLLATWR